MPGSGREVEKEMRDFSEEAGRQEEEVIVFVPVL